MKIIGIVTFSYVILASFQSVYSNEPREIKRKTKVPAPDIVADLWVYPGFVTNSEKYNIGSEGGGYYPRFVPTQMLKGEDAMGPGPSSYGSESGLYKLPKGRILDKHTLEPLSYVEKIRLYIEPFRSSMKDILGYTPSDSELLKMRTELHTFIAESEGLKEIFKEGVAEKGKLPKELLFEGMDKYDFNPREVLKHMPKIPRDATIKDIQNAYKEVFEMLGGNKKLLRELYKFYKSEYEKKYPLGPVITPEENMLYNKRLLRKIISDENANIIPRSVFDEIVVYINSKEGKADIPRRTRNFLESINKLLLRSDGASESDSSDSNSASGLGDHDELSDDSVGPMSQRYDFPRGEDSPAPDVPGTNNVWSSSVTPQGQGINLGKNLSTKLLKFLNSKFATQAQKRVVSDASNYVVLVRSYFSERTWGKLLRQLYKQPYNEQKELEENFLLNYSYMFGKKPKTDINTIINSGAINVLFMSSDRAKFRGNKTPNIVSGHGFSLSSILQGGKGVVIHNKTGLELTMDIGDDSLTDQYIVTTDDRDEEDGADG